MFKEIEKGVTRRLSSLNHISQLKQKVTRLILTLYPRSRGKKLVQHVEHRPLKKELILFTTTKDIGQRFTQDKEKIHAVVRREGLDIKRVVIK